MGPQFASSQLVVDRTNLTIEFMVDRCIEPVRVVKLLMDIHC